MTVPVSELQKIAPSAIIELFELQLITAIHGANTIYRFHAGTNATTANGNVVWAGNTYQAFPIEADGFEYSGNGQLPRPKIRVSNILGTITAIILATPLEGAKVTRIRTMARYLDAVNFAGNNLLLWSEDITQTVYFVSQCTKTSTTTITLTGTSDPYCGQQVGSLGSILNRTFSAGVKLKGIGASIGKYVSLYLYSSSTNEVANVQVGPLTSEYQLFTITYTFVSSTNTGIQFRVDAELGTGWSIGQAFDATEWQVNEGSLLFPYQPTFSTQNPYGTPDPTAEFPREIYYIDRKSAENRDVVEFELAASFDLIGVRAPKRQCISNICQWVYRSAECSYTGTNYFTESDVATTLANDVCGKRVSSCKARFGATAQLPFGSFPGVGTYFT
jgi:hypothetical protein